MESEKDYSLAIRDIISQLSALKKAKGPEEEIKVLNDKKDVLIAEKNEKFGKKKVEKMSIEEKRARKLAAKGESPASEATPTASPVSKEEKAEVLEGDSQVTPWDVGDDDVVDYDKLRREFGASSITPELLERFERVTGERPHLYLRRGLFYSHRDLENILDLYEQGKPFYLYTGRGPSSDSLHLGHMMPFIFTQYLQRVFGCYLVVQLTDDEKYLWKGLTLEESQRFLEENAKDIIACGFDPEKTFMFSNFDYMGTMYKTVVQIQRRVSGTTASKVFGFNNESNIGQWAFPAIQIAPAFSEAFPAVFNNNPRVPCLIPCGIDQDNYFRVARDVAPRLKFLKPALIHSKFFPPLQGAAGKMSASKTEGAIFVTDTPKQIKNKINKYSFSGGRETVEDHRKYGGNPDIDVSYQYLTFFLDDDEELKRIYDEYKSGRMLTGELKKILIDLLVEITSSHQQRRGEISAETIKQFFTANKFE